LDDYPRTLAEFDARFGTDRACRAYLSQLRWPAGFRCPRCGEAKAWAVRTGRWQCVACGRQTSVTAGTIFHDTRTPLTMWFRAMWCVTSTKTGTSALGLQQHLGLGSYQTAWAWLHKLRRAMVRPGRERLSGRVEVDESFIGALGGAEGRSTATKALIVVAVEEAGRGMGRIRMRRIPRASAENLDAFIHDAIEPGSEIHTDGWHGYDHIKGHGYPHRVTYLRGDHELAVAQLPRVHRVVSLLKRWLLGTHQGAVSQAHLDDYLDEFTFRFNRRRSRHRGKLFFRLVQQAVTVDPVPYRRLVQRPRQR
jgi:transposase-like protein/ribosomal protein L37AE/L43A